MKSVAVILIGAIGLVAIIAGILAAKMARMHPQQAGLQQVTPAEHSAPVIAATTSPTTMASTAAVQAQETKAPAGNAIVLSAKAARIHGYQLHFDRGGDGQIVYWVDPREYIEWPDGCPRSGKFTIELTYSCAKEAGGRYQVAVGPYLLGGHVKPTGDWKTYRAVTVGTITLDQDRTTILLQCEGELHNALMNVKQMRLIPE